MEVSTALIGIADFILQALHLIHIREHGIGILHHAESLIPETLHIVAVATTCHTGCRSQLGIKVVLETATHIGLGIHAHIRHQIVGGKTHIIPVVIDDISFQLLVALCHGSLQTRLSTIGSTWLIERKRILLQEIITARNHGTCQSDKESSSIYILDILFHFDKSFRV